MTKYANQTIWVLLIIFLGTLSTTPVSWASHKKNKNTSGSSGSKKGTYYVSPKGKDSNPGTKQQPWGSLDYAASRVKPGDTVLIARGTYDPFRIRQGGTRSRKVTFQAESGARGRVVIKGKKRAFGIFVWKTSYVSVDGVVIDGSRSRGFEVVNSDHITLRNSTVKNAGQSCVSYRLSNFGRVENNRLYNCGRRGSNGEGVYLGSSSGQDKSRGHVVRNNTIYNTIDEGVELKSNLQDILVEKNKIYDIRVRDGGGIHVGKAGGGHIVRNNSISRVKQRSGNKLMPAIHTRAANVKIYGNSMSQTAGCKGPAC